eukprot:TRINITY_DN2109_c0_g5_i1.p1 TRINITY_DN2109_c0_g5~~TRINITY_DN2109_c0_g5_i1.p1  ORF type:complete len:199 (-),score=51.25 TRINITY_DN2109_c0_g5_i1:108-704(-)
MKVAVVCLLIIGVALSQNYESCFDHLRKIAKGQVARSAKITPSNALEYILRGEDTIKLIQNIGEPCTDVGKFFTEFSGEGIKYATATFPKVFERIKEASSKIGPSINNETNAVKRATIVRKFVSALNQDILQVGYIFNKEVYHSFYKQTASQECSSRVARTYAKRNSGDALVIVEETTANFKFCIALPRVGGAKNSQK